MTRLRPHAFGLVRGDDEYQIVFYAATRAAARKLAEAWAKPRGWTVLP